MSNKQCMHAWNIMPMILYNYVAVKWSSVHFIHFSPARSCRNWRSISVMCISHTSAEHHAIHTLLQTIHILEHKLKLLHTQTRANVHAHISTKYSTGTHTRGSNMNSKHTEKWKSSSIAYMKPLTSHDTNRLMYKGHPNENIWRFSNTCTYAHTQRHAQALTHPHKHKRIQTVNKRSRCWVYLDTNNIEKWRKHKVNSTKQ